ncbi:hypothetical protein NQ314_010634 [Rhamnusium bicolor]|uniref:DDE Tnp4 domain-containing protein n=1 Tax=Rhamnusium bicolor TaxID=1586634 RepID=A0AAV8XNY7_9CUCU|nr:hypothetical protein NQ314_010634 [Rhamnusium bicolor]
MMKPYTKAQANVDKSKAIYNYQQFRARRVSENAFALFTQVFRIFYTPIAVLLETTDLIVTATFCLHKMLRNGYLETHDTPYFNCDPDAHFSKVNMIPFTETGEFASTEGFEIRDVFRTYFNSPQGSVS